VDLLAQDFVSAVLAVAMRELLATMTVLVVT
jgi:hypothetical protein